MKHSIPKIAATTSGLLLLFSLFAAWPPISYVLLRYLVGITAVVLVVRAEEKRLTHWIFIWIAVAVVFNPIVPLRLPAPLHQALSLVCGVLFLASVWRFRL
jgi:hypothetical protein